ncbi:MAG: alpha/beta fold hydrolase [Opitutales bacterium]
MHTDYTLAATLADSLSLGPHWIYNQSKLQRVFPDGIFAFVDPISDYHPKRKAGQQTHVGDQLQLLRRSLILNDGFDAEGWRQDWVALMQDYDGYMDKATKETLASGGASPSGSDELAGASRLAPLLDSALPLAETIAAARAQATLTHGDPVVGDAAEFFVRAVFNLRSGADMEAALKQAAQDGAYQSLDVAGSLNLALASLNDDFRKVGSKMGLSCHMPEAFPLTLYFALRDEGDFTQTLSDNGLAGGDTSARAMVLAPLLLAANPDAVHPVLAKLSRQRLALLPGANRIQIPGHVGSLSGILEYPEGEPRAFALFAHCFTCGKDFLPEARITRALAQRGIATLRVDFTGLGRSEGDFAETSFVTNLYDLILAADWLRQNLVAPRLLVGHSLGGSAVYAAATQLPETRALVSIGAPSDPVHVTHLFGEQVSTIANDGEAEVMLGGRKFIIGKRFLTDLETYAHRDKLAELRNVNVLILHAPTDDVVGIDNAGQIFSAIKHPKSFVSLPKADHLLTEPGQAEYVAKLIEAWADQELDD